MELHRALISPWRRLLVEITFKIFVFTLKTRRREPGPPHYDEEDPTWIDDRSGTLLLCKICSAWRAIAMSTPALWNTLYLSADDVERRPLDWVSTWLDRSKCFPVYLQLFWDHKALPDLINSLMSVAVVSHLHHIAELEIEDLDFNRGRRSLFSVLNYPKTVYGNGLMRFAVFPRANLTGLTLWSPTLMRLVFEIFEHALNLRHVDFNIVEDASMMSPKSLLGMKSVSTLKLSFDLGLRRFLEQAEFPSLVGLHFFGIGDWSRAELHSFLSHQGEIIACLQHKACNTLESLSVRDCSIVNEDDALLKLLTYYGPQHPFCCPNLRAIWLGNFYATDGLILAFVESRLVTLLSKLPSAPPPPARLKQVRLSFLDLVDDESKEAEHPEDSKRLREVEKIADKSELDIVWLDEEGPPWPY
ncbi:hypothetical protein DFH08DRAFT_810663 [Mycena albidolilacea]|uniref:F-box domain-containing protein n=1 Tax=Mycena albidolilacea TaxID=1033008 RepID=A0AAD6ZWU3_9AGAR|nr:hypothetical protein DFH08DRAFT_810663 [Mycena albidolilacea]